MKRPVNPWLITQNKAGHIIGWYQVTKKAKDYPDDLIRHEIQKFLIELNKEKRMSNRMYTVKLENPTEKINMVWLAGNLKFDPRTFNNGIVKALLDTGQKQAIQISARDEIGKMLAKFAASDYLRVIAILEPWGSKQDGEWKNGLNVTITEIKTKPPERERKQAGFNDDEVPY